MGEFACMHCDELMVKANTTYLTEIVSDMHPFTEHVENTALRVNSDVKMNCKYSFVDLMGAG